MSRKVSLVTCYISGVYLIFFLSHGKQEDQAELMQAAGFDPEALAALPPEMQQEILEQVTALNATSFPHWALDIAAARSYGAPFKHFSRFETL